MVEINIARSSWSVGYFKSWSKQIKAEDTEVDALLAQAEYIFNNADEFVGVEEMEMVAWVKQ